MSSPLILPSCYKTSSKELNLVVPRTLRTLTKFYNSSSIHGIIFKASMFLVNLILFLIIIFSWFVCWISVPGRKIISKKDPNSIELTPSTRQQKRSKHDLYRHLAATNINALLSLDNKRFAFLDNIDKVLSCVTIFIL